jgi:predicted O-methyltransferase YrrM
MEIGSWEGRSALFFLNYLPHSRVVCIDTFEGGQEHQIRAKEEDFLPHIEKRFDANTAAFASRIEKIKARSSDALAELGLANRRFDVAYIDGSHRAVDVYSDAALTWPLMAPGALVIFDDYQWDMMPEPLDNPRQGVDAFLATFKGQYRIVHNDYQVAVVKQ